MFLTEDDACKHIIQRTQCDLSKLNMAMRDSQSYFQIFMFEKHNGPETKNNDENITTEVPDKRKV